MFVGVCTIGGCTFGVCPFDVSFFFVYVRLMYVMYVRHFFKDKLVGSTLRSVVVKHVYSPTRFV